MVKTMIDLHLHLDGSLSCKTVRRLAEIQGILLDTGDDRTLAQRLTAGHCKDLNEYLTYFEFPLSLLQTSQAIAEAVFLLAQELKAEGMLYAEIRFAPQLHQRCGLSQQQVVEAACLGLERTDFSAGLILCCMRGDTNHAQNVETVEIAAAYRNKGVVGLDLAGAEGIYSTNAYKDIFSLAHQKGVPYTIHAGEADGADSVRAAVNLGAVRIGHGIRAVEDRAVMRFLAECGICLELCPTSNFQTGAAKQDQYPLRTFLNAGIPVTVNTDNRTVSGTTISQEFQLIQRMFALSRDEMYILLSNAAKYAFVREKTKAQLQKALAQYLKLSETFFP